MAPPTYSCRCHLPVSWSAAVNRQRERRWVEDTAKRQGYTCSTQERRSEPRPCSPHAYFFDGLSGRSQEWFPRAIAQLHNAYNSFGVSYTRRRHCAIDPMAYFLSPAPFLRRLKVVLSLALSTNRTWRKSWYKSGSHGENCAAPIPAWQLLAG